MKQKVLHIITKSSWGGAQKYVVDLVSGLQEPYDQHVIYGANTFGTTNILEEQLQKLQVSGTQLSTMSRDVSLKDEISSFISLYKIIKERKPDVIHLNSPKAAGLGVLAGRLLQVKKIVYTVHGLALSEDRPFVQKILIALFSWITFILAHHIIFVSNKELLLVENWPGVKKKSTVVHNGVTSITHESRADVRAHIEQKINHTLENVFLIGSIGELNTNKGMTHTLQALEKLDDKNILYVHWGGGELEKKLEEEIADRGLINRVFLLGFDSEAKKYLSGLDLFVLPSIKEGLGYVLLEAGLAQLPVVASNTGGIPEIISHESTGLLVPPKDPQGLRDAITLLKNNPEQSQKYAHALHKHVHANFSLSSMIEKTKKIYEHTN